MTRLPLIAALCICVGPAMAQVTAPLGSPERADQIVQEARDLSRRMWTDLTEVSEEEATQEAVAARLSEACDNMFGRDPDATITNPLCYDVFLSRGLPD